MVDLNDFSGLVDLYYAKVFYHCVKLTKNNADSADITQNTFTKAFINIKNLRDISSFGAWLFTICNNEIKYFYKNQDKNISDDFNIENIKANSGKIKKYDGLYSAVNLLDDKYKKLIILKYFADFSIKEIAELIGLDGKLIKSRLYDARKKLKNILSNQDNQENSAGLTNIYSYNQERKQEIMSTVKLLELGLNVIPSMSRWGQNELLKCAESNEKFSSEVLSELAKIEKGDEFTAECGGKLSYDEFIKILAGCDWSLLYEFEDTHKIMRDVAGYLGTGGYIESIESVIYVPSVKNTINWYKKYLGWDSDFSREAEDYGHAIVHICSNEDSPYMSKAYRRFHLRKAADAQAVTKCSFFMIVTHKQLELIRERIISAGWEKISNIHDSGFGPQRFTVEDLNGVGLEFLEWNHGE